MPEVDIPTAQPTPTLATELFEADVIFSLLTECILCPGFEPVHQLIEWQLGYPVMTHQLASGERFVETAQTLIYVQYPNLMRLNGVKVEGVTDEASAAAWVTSKIRELALPAIYTLNRVKWGFDA